MGENQLSVVTYENAFPHGYLVGNGMVLLLLSMGENHRDRKLSVTVIVGSISSYI